MSLAGIVYIAGSFARVPAPELKDVVMPTYLLPFVAELSPALWLTVKGVGPPETASN